MWLLAFAVCPWVGVAVRDGVSEEKHMDLPDFDPTTPILHNLVNAGNFDLEVTRCWSPQAEGASLGLDHYASQTEQMRLALKTYLAKLPTELGKKESTPQVTVHPLWGQGGADSIQAAYFPKHFVADITGEGEADLRKMKCLNFDYDADVIDVDGCAFFKRSFQPLKELVHNIEPLVQKDKIYNFWRSVALGEFLYEGEVPAAVEEWITKFHQINGSIVERARSLWEEGAKAGDSWWPTGLGEKAEIPPDSVSLVRTFELIKRVTFKLWKASVDDVDAVVTAKAQETSFAPRREKMKRYQNKKGKPLAEVPPVPTLEETTVAEILLQFKEGGDRKTLERVEAMKCLPVIWDRAEVPGAPFQPLIPSTFPGPTTSEYDGWGAWAIGGVVDWVKDVHYKHHVGETLDVHPIIGRLALAGMAEGFTFSRYPNLFPLIWQTMSGGTIVNKNYSTYKWEVQKLLKGKMESSAELVSYDDDDSTIGKNVQPVLERHVGGCFRPGTASCKVFAECWAYVVKNVQMALYQHRLKRH